MKKRGSILNLRGIIGTLAIFAGLILLVFWNMTRPENSTAASTPFPEKKMQIKEAYGGLPLYFIENQGQQLSQVKYYVHIGGQTVWFTADGITFTLETGTATAPESLGFRGQHKFASGRSQAGLEEQAGPLMIMKMAPVGLKEEVKILGVEAQINKVNYLTGKDPQKWRTNVPTYQAVMYQEAYKGIDLKFYGTGRQLEYDVIVKPGADPDQVKFQYAGAKSLEVTAKGDLIIKLLGNTELVQKKPFVYQEINGQRVVREGKFRVIGDTTSLTYGFDLAAYDPAYPLVIDPTIAYATYLGGNYHDSGEDIAVDVQGHAYIVGSTSSSDFPSTQGTCNNGDVFVAKLTPDGSQLLFATYLGGSGADDGYGIALDSHGYIFVTGTTRSADFPTTTGAFQDVFKGPTTVTGGDVFLTKLTPEGSLISPEGSPPVFSTYLGGTGSDIARGIAVDPAGNVVIAGTTYSRAEFPVSGNAYQQIHVGDSYAGSQKGFVAKFAPEGQNLFCTYLGGKGNDIINDVALDFSGDVYVTGRTQSLSLFPITPNALWLKPGLTVPNQDGGARNYGFFTKLTSDGSEVIYSTYIGGYSNPAGNSIAVDGEGKVYIAGSIGWFNPENDVFPIVNAQQSIMGGFSDGFVMKLQPELSGAFSYVYSTYLGGNHIDGASGIVVDQWGRAWVTGDASSANFPTVNSIPLNTGDTGFMNFFVAAYSPEGSLVFSTVLGGNRWDQVRRIAVDLDGNAYLTGYTGSSNLATPGAYQEYLDRIDPRLNRNPRSDAFVMKIGPLPPPNLPPQVDAGANRTVDSEGLSSTEISGVALDPDGDPLNYRWREGETILLNWQTVTGGATPLNLGSLNLAMGQHTLTLEVSDSHVTVSDTMLLSVDNSPPHAAPSGGGVYEFGRDQVLLAGEVSDYDGDSLTYVWKEGDTTLFSGTVISAPGGAPVPLTPYPVSGLSLGDHTFSLTVSDGNSTVVKEIQAKIQDNQAPTLAPVASQGILWPPNHKMVDIVIHANASDINGSPALAARVTSNEPVEGLGDGDMAPDWTEPVIYQNSGVITLQLRAERSGKGKGRIYTVSITATDASGNAGTAHVQLIVPHDMGKGGPIAP